MGDLWWTEVVHSAPALLSTMSDHGDAPGQVQEEGSGVGLAPAQDSFHVQRQGDIAEIDDSYDNTDFEQSSEERLDAGDSSEAEQIENYQDEATGRQTKRDAEMYEDIRSELEHLSEMQVDPEVGMKVAKSRMHLQVRLQCWSALLAFCTG